tara:strand:- start:12765 stop:13151 length:387 start_codon:yes stop_codon:yes gene_type:complete
VIKVFTNGCFDILHIGHVRCLEYAKKQGDYLIVGLNSDTSVKKLKGKDRPFNTQSLRKEMLEALRCVDEVIIFEEDTPYNLIFKIKPDIIVKGGDYTHDEVVGNGIAEVKIFNFVDGHSTTNILKNNE